ncbi:MAG: hypothetical protein H6828_06790 [Planctomycetes bacterium]|nr:hypothetical protein [Planctomycetota bacterium]
MGDSKTRIELTFAGCPNGVPTSGKGKGHFGVPPGSEFARLDLEVATYLEPLGWDLALSMPGLLEPLLFVLARLPVGLSERATTGWYEEFATAPVWASTQCRLVEGMASVVASVEAAHAITVRKGALSVRSELRRAECSFAIEEKVASMSLTRSAPPLPFGPESSASLASGSVETTLGRRCGITTTAQIAWAPNMAVFRPISPAAALWLERAPWGDAGGLLRLAEGESPVPLG